MHPSCARRVTRHALFCYTVKPSHTLLIHAGLWPVVIHPRPQCDKGTVTAMEVAIVQWVTKADVIPMIIK